MLRPPRRRRDTLRGTAQKTHQSPAGEPGTLKYRTDETARIALPHNKIVDAEHVDVNQVDTLRVDGKNVNAKSVEPSAVDRKRSLGDAVVMDEHEITVAQLELRQLLADNVRRFRNAQNVSQEGLAALAGLHRTYVSQIERKVTNTSLDNIAKLALALRIHAGELLQKPQVQTGAPTDEAEAKAGTHPNSRRG